MSVDWREIPSLTALRAFEATARDGSFAQAARSLNVTHAAIAQQVRALEADLGVRLARREGRSVHLTPEGLQLAQVLSESFLRIAAEVERMRAGGRNKALRVTTTPFLTDRKIVPRLAEFWAAHPGAEISLSPSRGFVDVVREGFDLAIRAQLPALPKPSPGTDGVPVGQAELIAIAAPGVAAQYGPDLYDLPWLWHDGMEVKLELMMACGLDTGRLKQVPIGSPNLLMEAVRGGVGVTLFNESIARAEIAAGGVVQVPLPRASRIEYVALFPKGPRHPLAEPFARWVATLL